MVQNFYKYKIIVRSPFSFNLAIFVFFVPLQGDGGCLQPMEDKWLFVSPRQLSFEERMEEQEEEEEEMEEEEEGGEKMEEEKEAEERMEIIVISSDSENDNSVIVISDNEEI